MLRSKKLRISGFQWFVFPCSSFVVAYISVSRLLAVVNIRRSISAPRARNAKLHASVLESCCLPLLFFSTLFFFFFFLFFFFFFLFSVYHWNYDWFINIQLWWYFFLVVNMWETSLWNIQWTRTVMAFKNSDIAQHTVNSSGLFYMRKVKW